MGATDNQITLFTVETCVFNNKLCLSISVSDPTAFVTFNHVMFELNAFAMFDQLAFELAHFVAVIFASLSGGEPSTELSHCYCVLKIMKSV